MGEGGKWPVCREGSGRKQKIKKKGRRGGGGRGVSRGWSGAEELTKGSEWRRRRKRVCEGLVKGTGGEKRIRSEWRGRGEWRVEGSGRYLE